MKSFTKTSIYSQFASTLAVQISIENHFFSFILHVIKMLNENFKEPNLVKITSFFDNLSTKSFRQIFIKVSNKLNYYIYIFTESVNYFSP